MALSIYTVSMLVTVLLSLASSQKQMGPSRLSEIFVPNFGPESADITPFVRSLFPSFLRTASTLIQVRVGYLYALVGYNVCAACDSTALSFFGVKDQVPKSFCDLDTKATIYAYQIHRVLENELPDVASSVAAFLSENGLDPSDRSTDVSTVVGWANVNIKRIVEYLSTDGWNALGDVTRMNYRQSYSDSTGYKPINHANLGPQELFRPLRWQPLVIAVDGRGTFSHQIHDMPHLGVKGKPLVMTSRELMTRGVSGPYKTPNRRKELGEEDGRLINKLINEVFRRSTKLTTEKVLLALWWNNKFRSTGTFGPYFAKELGIGRLTLTEAELYLGDTMAQHDAALLAWKEKVRHDLVRPTTMIRRLRGGNIVRAFLGLGQGVGNVDAGEWEPAVPVQAHSEFPSASAVLCTASTEYLDMFLKDFVGNKSAPAYKRTLVFGEAKVSVNFKNGAETLKSCGESRLDAGVHFSPSVPAGIQLGEGIGKKAFEHLRELVNGNVPFDCERCGDKLGTEALT